MVVYAEYRRCNPLVMERIDAKDQVGQYDTAFDETCHKAGCTIATRQKTKVKDE